MVRRTRTEIAKYFADDLKRQNLKFPEVENPEPLFYGLNANEDEIFFTESKETAQYLSENINKKFPDSALLFTGGSGEATRDKVIENFDAKARHPKDDYRILISTEVLSEGVNLHRSNVVVNYDIPWNPTRMMQRVGRINRIDTQFDRIHTFNFFPTKQSNDQIKLREAAEAKINAFLTLLGGDAALLTEGEPVESHELFNRLISNKAIIGDDEDDSSELKFLKIIKDLRDKDPDTFEKIKRLPKKARSAKSSSEIKDSLITYFRRGKLQKFFIADDAKSAQELDFLSAAAILESGLDDKKLKLPERFYELLDMNKEAFVFATTDGMPEPHGRAGRDSSGRILGILKATMKNTKQLTDAQELYLERVFTQIEEGGIPKQTAKETLKALDELKKDIMNPLKVLAVLQTQIPERFLAGHYAERHP